jgi:type VI secretion system protein ImpE
MAESAEGAVRSGDLDAALSALQGDIRKRPEDKNLRVFLFQLHAVRGDWTRAGKQLDVLVEMDAQFALMAQTCRALLAAEATRARIFAGTASPALLGEPPAWSAMLAEALVQAAQGRHAAAQSLREAAFAEATALPGRIDGQPFLWLADADPRLGPILEAVVDARYLWIPFERIRRITFEPVTDLRDLVWLPAQFSWDNNGETVGFVPTRYVGTESRPEGALRLARSTDWRAPEAEAAALGSGQRMLATDSSDVGLLECRLIELGTNLPPPAHG